MKPTSIVILLICGAMLLPLGGCPKRNEPWDNNRQELKPVRQLSEEEKAAFQKLRNDKYQFDGLSEVEHGLENDAAKEREREIKRLKTLVEGIRQNCRGVVDHYMKIYENLSYSDYDAFYKDEEKARILGKYDVCSDILARMEETGID